MFLERRVSRLEEQLAPPETIKVRCIIRHPDSPEPEYPPGTLVIKVELGASKENLSD